MKTDVLVIGAGGAGLVAAIAARKQGAEVAVCSKSSSGLGGCTAYAGGGFTLAVGKVTPAEHKANTWSVGRRVNQEPLLNVLSNQGEQALRQLQDWGVTIDIGDGHATVTATAARPIMGGAGFTRELTEIARRQGVQFRENVVATRLLLGDGAIQGVHLVDWQTGSDQVITAGSVILATGGAGQIYRRTDNPARITGDGYALALAAGLPLIDMEFVQFYPLGWAEPGFPRWMIGLPVIDRARLTDQNGEEFLLQAIQRWGLKNGREANLFARDRSAQEVGRKWHHGGKVHLHLEEVQESDWDRRSLRQLLAFYPPGVSPRQYGPVQVAPIQHYFTGGVVIDNDGRTDIPGLFACGEVTGGVDGASRIGGNALTNIVTFGLRAGTAAASERRPHPDAAAVGRIRALGGNSLPPAQLREQIQDIVEAGIGPIRTAAEMARAIDRLDEIKPQLDGVRIDSARDRLLALEMPGLWMSARAVLQAALLREESRGVHYREDFPEEQEQWQRNILVEWRDGRMVAR
ncbi:MAG: FAD-binding protein [Bacillota bacterium]|jgi:succinate dehydrogenase/fumarate reductase flavoprotein subunit